MIKSQKSEVVPASEALKELQKSEAVSASAASKDKGWIKDLAKEREGAWHESLRAGNTSRIEEFLAYEKSCWAREDGLVKARVEASLKEADALRGAPRTPETVQQWLKLLTNLEPGPFSSYMFSCLGDAARSNGPVRDHLLKIQAAWHQEHGDKIFYRRDFARLAGVLEPKPMTFLSWIGSLFGRDQS